MLQQVQGSMEFSIVPWFIFPAKSGNHKKRFLIILEAFSLAAPQNLFHIEFCGILFLRREC